MRAAILAAFVPVLGCFVDPGIPPGASEAATAGSSEAASASSEPASAGTGSTTGVPGDPTCYATDFSAEPKDWVVVSPEFMWLPEGTYRGAGAPALARLEGTSLLGARANVRVRVGGDGRAGVVLRAADLPSGPFVYIELHAGGVRGYQDGFEGAFLSFGMTVGVDAWHELAVEMTGDALKIDLDGSQLVTGLPLPGHGAGSVALAVAGGSADFDSITVCPL